MLESYENLRKVDVRPYCKRRDGYWYLNWAKCIDLLHQHGAEKVYFDIVQNPKTGGSLYESETEFEDKNHNTNRCYETRIRVVVDDQEWFMHSPVMNGTNPVKDNSMSQQRVWNSMCRSFVKCIAINTGLGFDLWLDEEDRPLETPLYDENAKPTMSEIATIKKISEELHINLKAWIARSGKTLETLTSDDVGKILRTLNEEKSKRATA